MKKGDLVKNRITNKVAVIVEVWVHSGFLSLSGHPSNQAFHPDEWEIIS